MVCWLDNLANGRLPSHSTAKQTCLGESLWNVQGWNIQITKATTYNDTSIGFYLPTFHCCWLGSLGRGRLPCQEDYGWTFSTCAGWTKGSRDSSVVRALDWKVVGLNPCRSGGIIFFSRVNFLCWLLFWYPFHPHVITVAHKRSRSFCQKCRWQVTAKHTCTLHMWLCMKWYGAWLYGVHRTCQNSSSFMWH